MVNILDQFYSLLTFVIVAILVIVLDLKFVFVHYLVILTFILIPKIYYLGFLLIVLKILALLLETFFTGRGLGFARNFRGS